MIDQIIEINYYTSIIEKGPKRVNCPGCGHVEHDIKCMASHLVIWRDANQELKYGVVPCNCGVTTTEHRAALQSGYNFRHKGQK